MFQLQGDYRYGGAIINGQKYSIIRNGSELVRVRKVFDRQPSEVIWDESMPMSLDVLSILQAEQR